MTDNLITQRLQKYFTEKLATAATDKSHMDIDLETNADGHQLQDIIKKQTLEETKNIHRNNSIALRTLLAE